MEVPQGGGKRSNTKNLIKHLKNDHPMEYAAYCQAKSSAMAGLKQQMLQDSLKRKDLLPRDSERFRKIPELIVECIAEDNQPVSLVENAAFCRLIKEILQRWEYEGFMN